MPRLSYLTRRSMMAGGALLLAPGLLLSTSRKLTQADARYQPVPKGIASCGSCASFVAPASCRTVAGELSPQGWCRLYIMLD